MKFFSLLIFTFSLFSDSLMLLNDSPFDLDVVVVDALGKVRGQLSLKPRDQLSWQVPPDYYNRNMSPPNPYSVFWYCKDGADFGAWTNAPSGSMVSAQNCNGPKICKIKRPKKGEVNTNIND